jgi:hypothetical protein
MWFQKRKIRAAATRKGGQLYRSIFLASDLNLSGYLIYQDSGFCFTFWGSLLNLNAPPYGLRRASLRGKLNEQPSIRSKR